MVLAAARKENLANVSDPPREDAGKRRFIIE
jgi:hypothetical protein